MPDPISSLIDYDALPYESYPFSETHPSHLAGIAAAFGLAPPSITDCNVLELGCASGGNIIPLAYRYPDSTVVGVDLAASQIDDGISICEQLRLQNIHLLCGDFSTVQLPHETYDYIIAHGLFSWIGEEARRQLLALCRDRLSENGIAYISYNAFPGWHSRMIVRDLLRFHLRNCSSAEEIIAKGRHLIEQFRSNNPAPDLPEGVLLTSLLNDLAEMPDWYIFHEFLEAHNQPLYFEEFIELAESHGLRYVTDSDLSTDINSPTAAAYRPVLNSFSDNAIEQTQYADFLNQRLLRRAVLVHSSCTPAAEADPLAVSKLYIASPAVPKSDFPSLTDDNPETFKVEKRGSMAFSKPIAKAAFTHLASMWPEGIAFDELHEAVSALLPDVSAGDIAGRSQLSQAVTDAFLCGAVNLDPIRPACIRDPGPKPHVCGFARAEAERSMRITGLRHHYLVLDGFAKILIALLDGTNTEEDCYQELKTAKVEVYDEDRRRSRKMNMSNLGRDQFHEWYNLVTKEFSRRALFTTP